MPYLSKSRKSVELLEKKIHVKYDSLVDFVNRFADDPAIGSHTKAYESICAFLNEVWETKESEPITTMKVTE